MVKEEKLQRWLKWGRGVLLIVGLLSFGIGCTRHIYVPVERHVRDTIRELHTRVDSIYNCDSIYVAQRGDTVLKEVYRWRERIRTRVDTIYRNRVDSVPVVVKENPGGTSARRESRIAQAITWGSRGLMIVIALVLLLRYWRKYDAK